MAPLEALLPERRALELSQAGIVAFLSGSPRLDALKDQVDEAERSLSGHAESTRAVADALKLPFEEDARGHWGLTLENQIRALDVWLKRADVLPHVVRFNEII